VVKPSQLGHPVVFGLPLLWLQILLLYPVLYVVSNCLLIDELRP
jgi:hypothetical protein